MKLRKIIFLSLAAFCVGNVRAAQEKLLNIGFLSAQETKRAAKYNIDQFIEVINQKEPIAKKVANIVLYDAIYLKRFNIVQLAIRHGGDVNCSDITKGSPLSYARIYGNQETVEYLISQQQALKQQETEEKENLKKSRQMQIEAQAQEEARLNLEKIERRKAQREKERELQEQQRTQQQQLALARKQLEQQKKETQRAERAALQIEQEEKKKQQEAADAARQAEIEQRTQLRAERDVRKAQKAIERQQQAEQDKVRLEQELQTINQAFDTIKVDFVAAMAVKKQSNLTQARDLLEQELAKLRFQLQTLHSKAKTPSIEQMLKDGEALFITIDQKASSLKKQIRREQEAQAQHAIQQNQQEVEPVQLPKPTKVAGMAFAQPSPRLLQRSVSPASPAVSPRAAAAFARAASPLLTPEEAQIIHMQTLARMQANFIAARQRYAQYPEIAQQLKALRQQEEVKWDHDLTQPGSTIYK